MGKSTYKDLWDRDKDGSKKEQRGLLRFVIVATAVFLLFLLTGKNSLIRWAQTGIELRRQKREIEYYQKEIKRLDTQIDALSNNKDTLETYAREHFNFASPGDDVYILDR